MSAELGIDRITRGNQDALDRRAQDRAQRIEIIHGSETEEEDSRQETYWESLSPEEQRAYQERNWERVFDITPLDNHWIRRGDWVQATVWELREESIRNVRFFKTGKLKDHPMLLPDMLEGQTKSKIAAPPPKSHS